MKVAYFIGALNRGGAESLILDVCRQHEKVPYGFVCVYRREGNISEAFKTSGAPLLHIPKSGGVISYIWLIRKALLSEQVTIVHSQTPSNTLLLAIALIGTGIPIITTFHGHMFAAAPGWKRKIVYAASDKILCVSEYQKRYYEQKWGLPKGNKLTVVYNGIDFTKLNVTKEGVNELTIGRGVRLCMVGNFIKGRSQIVVCKAVDRLKSLGVADFDFYFIGRRDEAEPWRYEECVKYCEVNNLTNVHFMGARENVPELLKTMDGFVYSTEHDTFGIAVIEAIASGLPIVVNDWPVMTEVCDLILPESNHAVRFFKTDDATDCADKIAELLNNLQSDKEPLSVDCKYASEVAREKYSIQNHIERLNEIYSSMNE